MTEENKDFHSLSDGYYVCPICRFTFKYRSESGTLGLICPGCDHLLRVELEEADLVRSSRQLAEQFDERKVPEWEKGELEYSLRKDAKVV